MNSVGLKDLGLENECWSVTVRICRVWESINTKKNGELISMDMVLVDEQDTLMAGTISRNLVTKFQHLLKKFGNMQSNIVGEKLQNILLMNTNCSWERHFYCYFYFYADHKISRHHYYNGYYREHRQAIWMVLPGMQSIAPGLAERMVDSSALKLFNKYDSSSDEFPKEITDLCGKKLIFKLHFRFTRGIGRSGGPPWLLSFE
ncbi:hypothetical protein OSB04_un001659 [Centaurea solstitialis]|uniref:Replication protein A 70 kDa DNA-binding subunit B/D first OB fold domain-containing protein n=1 Tax=Centaurea solstitialis TaxID=347529 RepID=A0AA38W2F3_9ASTR|nr:hypothetical protein OSB04_un001659 [Centaurea solstitialis]